MKVCNARRSDGHNFVPGHGSRLFCRGVICKGKIPLEASMKLRLWVWILVVASVAAWPVVGAPAADTNVVIQDAAGMKFANYPNVPTCFTGAVESGDPAHGPSVFLLKGAAGCKVPWHWHTPNEQVMIVSGIAKMEMKDAKPTLLHSGGFASMPSRHVHQFSCVGVCRAFVSSDTTFDIHYVDKEGKEITLDQALSSSKMKSVAKMK